MSALQRRRVAAATAIGVALVGLLAGCDLQHAIVPYDYAGSSPDGNQTPSDTPTPTPTFNYPLTPVIANYKTNDGFSVTVELDIGAVIPWTDTADTTGAWHSVGGTGDTPCGTKNPSIYPSQNFLPDRAGHAYGIMNIVNNVPQFAPNPFEVEMTTPDPKDAIGWGVGSNSQCVGTESGGGLSPLLTDGVAHWGPMPFDILLDNYLTPASPNGDPSRLSRNYWLIPWSSQGTPFTLTALSH